MTGIRRNMMSESLYILEEYIPLKVLISKDEEILDYLTYKKGSKSFLELSFGIHSGMIKRILILSCKEYEYIDDEILIDKYDEFDFYA